jgi:hypothetical protein
MPSAEKIEKAIADRIGLILKKKPIPNPPNDA